LLVAIGVLLTSTAAAAGSSFGVIGGLNIANLRIDGVSGMNTRTSFAVGGVLDLGITDRFGLRIEPTYLSKGGKAEQRNIYWGTVDGAVFDLDYVDIPLLARFDLATTETRAYLLGGVGLSLATKAQVEVTQTGATEKVDFGEVFNTKDVSLNLGAGVGFAVTPTSRMAIDGRVAIGLTDINDGGTITFQGGSLAVPSTPTKTLDVRFFVSYLIPFPGK
jgi:opacity protein-like surface antigen